MAREESTDFTVVRVKDMKNLMNVYFKAVRG